MTNMAKFGMTILAGALMSGSGMAARAQTAAPLYAADTAQQKVQLGDLDLASRAGQAAARRRLLMAAHVVCAAADAGADNQPMEESCQAAAMSDAREELARLIVQGHQTAIRLATR